MRLISPRTELAVLRAGTHRNPSISGTALSGIDESYFYSETSVEAFHRVQRILKRTGELPTWRELCEDPKLSEEVRARLKKFAKSDTEPLKSRKEVMRAVRQLNEYRQMRGMYELSESVVKKLRKGKVHIEEILDETGEDIVNLRQSRSEDATIVKFGVGNNADKIVAKLLKKDYVNFIPTGFDEFDSKNGGIGWGNLFTIGGSSGGGKSTLASQLAINWSAMGENVCIVPLEMTEEEMTARLMANAAELDVRKIIFRKLSEDEEKKYKRAYRKFVTKRKDSGGSLTFFKPKSDMSIEEIMACTYTLNPRIVIIDYISLLKGVDGDDQWQKLGAVARYCKVYAETHNIIVVLLCQVSEEGKIRYAQSIKEHCLTAGAWIDTPDGLKTIESFSPYVPAKHNPQKINHPVMSGDVAVPTSAFHNNGRKEVYELVAETGFAIEATAGHKFLALNERNMEVTWKRLGDLKIGDRIASTRAKSIWPKKSKKQGLRPVNADLHHNATSPTKYPRFLTKELAYFIGGMLSDGHTVGMNMVTIASQREFAEEMQRCYDASFGADSTRTREFKTKHGTYVIRVFFKHPQAVHPFMKANFDGWNGSSATKTIPTSIMQSSKEVAAACLRGMFDGDGTISGNSIVLDMDNQDMLHRAKVLLLKFGIHSLVARGNRLTINGLESQKVFAEEIGFTVYSKMAKTLELIHTKDSSTQQPRHLACEALYRKTVGKAVTITDKTIVQKNWELASKFDWVRVKSVESSGKKTVYDITVPDVHNYVANGLVTHNSNYCWTFVSTKESREAGIISITQLKARNGEMYDFNLKTRLDVMRIRSMTEEERNSTSSKSLTTNKKSKKSLNGKQQGSDGTKEPQDAKYLKDISDEVD